MNLRKHGVAAIGTFCSHRHGIPPEVIALKLALEEINVPCGTGYYYHHKKTGIMYCLWKDTRVVSVMSTCHPGHKTDTKVSRNCTLPDRTRGTMEIPRHMAHTYRTIQSVCGWCGQVQPIPFVLQCFAQDRYWKTLFYHVIDVAIMNAYVLYNHLHCLGAVLCLKTTSVINWFCR